jgi:hypothetical protein
MLYGMTNCNFIVLVLDGCRHRSLFHSTIALISCTEWDLHCGDSQSRLTDVEICAVPRKGVNNKPASTEKHTSEGI